VESHIAMCQPDETARCLAPFRHFHSKEDPDAT
jgi:hypothetical protein